MGCEHSARSPFYFLSPLSLIIEIKKEYLSILGILPCGIFSFDFCLKFGIIPLEFITIDKLHIAQQGKVLGPAGPAQKGLGLNNLVMELGLSFIRQAQTPEEILC
jgi:hypothetical protein